MDIPSAVRQPATKRRWWLWGVVGLIAAGIVAAAGLYQSSLGARLAPGLSFKINGPKELVAGQTATIDWDLSPRHQSSPTEKIEFCYGRLLARHCVLLAAAAPNNGRAQVQVPAAVPAVTGYIQITARTARGQLNPLLRSVLAPVTVRPAPVAPQEPGGGGGDSGGGGGGGSGSGEGERERERPQPTPAPTPTSTPDPSAEATATPSPLSSPTATPGARPDPQPAVSVKLVAPIDTVTQGQAAAVRGQLTGVTASDLACGTFYVDGVAVTLDQNTLPPC